MNTAFILMAQFGPRVAIPIEDVRQAFFSHLDMDKFLRKLSSGDIRLPVMRSEKSQKAAKYISMMDLAVYLDTQMAAGREEYERLRAASGHGTDANLRFVDLMFNGAKR